jgi:hypothetical protein
MSKYPVDGGQLACHKHSEVTEGGDERMYLFALLADHLEEV